MQVLVPKLDLELRVEWHVTALPFLDTDQHCFTPQKLSHCLDHATQHYLLLHQNIVRTVEFNLSVVCCYGRCNAVCSIDNLYLTYGF